MFKKEYHLFCMKKNGEWQGPGGRSVPSQAPVTQAPVLGGGKGFVCAIIEHIPMV